MQRQQRPLKKEVESDVAFSDWLTSFARRPAPCDRPRNRGCVDGALFGLVAHGVDAALHRVADQSPTLLADAWLIGAATVALAGVYQLSSLKHRCLDKCRSPLMFITERWRGKSARRESFLLGMSHGAFCIGCCWALMLLMSRAAQGVSAGCWRWARSWRLRKISAGVG